MSQDTALLGRATDGNSFMRMARIFTWPIMTEALQEDCSASPMKPKASPSLQMADESDSLSECPSPVIHPCGKSVPMAQGCMLYFPAGTIRPGNAVADGPRMVATSF